MNKNKLKMKETSEKSTIHRIFLIYN